jgi:hypothetical protein
MASLEEASAAAAHTATVMIAAQGAVLHRSDLHSGRQVGMNLLRSWVSACWAS